MPVFPYSKWIHWLMQSQTEYVKWNVRVTLVLLLLLSQPLLPPSHRCSCNMLCTNNKGKIDNFNVKSTTCSLWVGERTLNVIVTLVLHTINPSYSHSLNLIHFGSVGGGVRACVWVWMCDNTEYVAFHVGVIHSRTHNSWRVRIAFYTDIPNTHTHSHIHLCSDAIWVRTHTHVVLR